VILSKEAVALIVPHGSLWREKRGEVEPENLSGNLLVQLGLATEG
jgi:hypothetical protein